MKPQESFPVDQHQVRQLRKMVDRGEGFHLEFKRKALYPDKIVREMVAFANAGGGILLVGVGDEGTIPGLKHPEDDSHEIRKALERCRPRLPVTETFVPIGQGRSVLLYEISESRKKPHYLLNTGNERAAFVRVDDKSIRASREMCEIARRMPGNKGTRFHYGDFERMLIQYLDTHGTITLKEFIELSGLKRFIASKKVVTLVLAGVLRITPHEKGDIYSLALSR
jgi:hypothetical protein